DLVGKSDFDRCLLGDRIDWTQSTQVSGKGGRMERGSRLRNNSMAIIAGSPAMAKNAGLLILSLSFLFVSVAVSRNVTFDHRSLIIDGQRKLLISASIHYPRSVPAFYFEDRFDLVKFAKIVRDAGMYMILRIGPFVAAEWNYGWGCRFGCTTFRGLFSGLTVNLSRSVDE
ncbi:hypothetical protein GW17_00054611, partial [Ensete ventricosum]